MAQVAAVQLGDVLEQMDIGAVWLLIGFILVTMVVDLIMPAAIAKWAILAPIFIPLLIRLDVTPQTVLAAYRVGDSPLNVVTPLMAYFPLIVVFVQRYQKSAGIGTVVSLMLPYVIILSVAWTLFFVAWYLLGIPLGPGSPVHSAESGAEMSRSIPSRAERKRATSCPLTLLPAASSGGANVPIPPLPGETVTIPPPMPLLAGRPTSYSQSPDVSYSPAVSITASV